MLCKRPLRHPAQAFGLARDAGNALPIRAALGLLALFLSQPRCQSQVNIEEAPIRYSETADSNAVRELMAKIESGEVTLEYQRGSGYLRSLLRALDIPAASQVLVFSKTSMQVRYISPRNPRAIYFNDDVYVGWVRGSSLMEISASDPKLGAAFYTVDMTPSKPLIHRAYYDCLACHTTTLTQGVPGHTVRSVMAKIDGSVDVDNRGGTGSLGRCDRGRCALHPSEVDQYRVGETDVGCPRRVGEIEEVVGDVVDDHA